jgi:hypothetical protein
MNKTRQNLLIIMQEGGKSVAGGIGNYDDENDQNDEADQG